MAKVGTALVPVQNRLAEGAYIELNLDGDDSRIFSLACSGSVSVPASDRSLLGRLLLQGLPRHVRTGWLDMATRNRMVQWTRRQDDRLISKRLDALGQTRKWLRPGGQEGRLFARIYRATLRAHARRKVFVHDFGQTPCLPESSVRRAWCSRGRLGRVLCIGDDDLVSIALAMMGHQVEVVDIDGMVLIPLLRRLARDWDLPLRARVLDLREPFPAKLCSRFDWVYTDPMSTPQGLGLFWSRALSALRPGGCLVSCGHAAATDVLAQIIKRMHLNIGQHMADFNAYYNEDVEEDAYRSDLWLLHPSERSQPIHEATQPAAVDIFDAIDGYRQHVWCVVKAPAGLLSDNSIDKAVSALIDYKVFGDVTWVRHHDASGRRYLAILPEGGHVMVHTPADRRQVFLSVYPYNEERDDIAARVLASRLPYTVTLYGQSVARPWIDLG